jgi:hypothetical protein
MLYSVKSTLILLPFLSVALYESGIRQALLSPWLNNTEVFFDPLRPLLVLKIRATERNGNSISVDFTEYSIKNDENDACFCSFLTIWQLSWTFYFTLQYKHNIRTLSVNIKLTNLLSLSPRNRSEKFAKEYFLYLFLTLIQINIIFCDDVCILYIYCSNGQNLCVGEKSLLHK